MPKHNGRLFCSKADRLIGAVLACAMIVFFTYVRSGLLDLIGDELMDTIVRVFLEELFLAFLLFSFLALVWFLFQPRWLEMLLELSVHKIVVLIQIMFASQCVLLVLAVAILMLL